MDLTKPAADPSVLQIKMERVFTRTYGKEALRGRNRRFKESKLMSIFKGKCTKPWMLLIGASDLMAVLLLSREDSTRLTSLSTLTLSLPTRAEFCLIPAGA